MKQYLDSDFFSYISDGTSRHCLAVKVRNIKATAAEIGRFLGASIFMSCVGYPCMHCTAGRSGLVVTRLPAAREDPGSNRAANRSFCFHENHCDMQLRARVADLVDAAFHPPRDGK